MSEGVMMSTTAGLEDSNARPRRWQVRLADLIVLVLAVGVAVAVARGSRDVLGTRSMAFRPTGDIAVERIAGLLLEVLAVFLIFILAQGVLGLDGRVRSGSGRRMERMRPMDWRVLAISLLIGFVAAEWSILQVDYSNLTWPSLWRSGWEPIYRLRESLFPICGLLGMLGLTLGMGAGAILDRPETRRRRPYWLFVPLAALVALLLLAQPGWWSELPQLVLIALEGVWNAMRHHLVDRPSLSVRLLRAGIDAGVASLSCLSLALIVAHDFERSRRSEPWATTWRGAILRLFWLLTTMVAGTYVGLATIPAIDQHLANGFRDEIGPVEASMIVCGFGLFAAGLAARSIGGRPARERPRWLLRLATLLQLVILSLILFSVLKYVPSSTQFDPGFPPLVGRLVDGVGSINARLWGWFPDSMVGEVQQWLAPDRLVWILTILGLTMFVFEIGLVPKSPSPPPFDVATDSRAQAVRFLWLTVVCLAAVPILIVSGQTLVHIQLRGADWPVFGWPRVF
jgi:hypothetical protein